MQLNAPEYNTDKDGQPDPVTDIQSPNAKSIKEDTMSNTTNSEQHTALSPNTNRTEPQPSSVLDDTDHPGYQEAKQPRAEHPSDYRPQLEDIPELEDDEDNLQMLILLIITTPLRKVTEYVVSTLHILRKLQNRDTVLMISQHHA